ncbi:hypothetical protein B0H14DRAFT_2753420 [Mycena olivaceomarginata]|nr:hypothetical protein B0H14DRAFT_2753420 [Mycena olivaceomarginata]
MSPLHPLLFHWILPYTCGALYLFPPPSPLCPHPPLHILTTICPCTDSIHAPPLMHVPPRVDAPQRIRTVMLMRSLVLRVTGTQNVHIFV